MYQACGYTPLVEAGTIGLQTSGSVAVLIDLLQFIKCLLITLLRLPLIVIIDRSPL